MREQYNVHSKWRWSNYLLIKTVTRERWIWVVGTKDTLYAMTLSFPRISFAALLMIMGVHLASTLQCYTCTADTPLSCNKTERADVCQHTSRRFTPQCLTVQYTNKKDEVHHVIKEWIFETRCVGGEYPCEFYCNALDNAYDCTATCCNTNLCNKALKDVQVVNKVQNRRNLPVNGECGMLPSSVSLLLVLVLSFYFL